MFCVYREIELGSITLHFVCTIGKTMHPFLHSQMDPSVDSDIV